MQYIIEVPETRLPELFAAVTTINPQAPPPIAVSRNQEGLTSNMEYVEDYYLDELMDELTDGTTTAPPWNELSEETRMAIGAALAGYPSWQFPDIEQLDTAEAVREIRQLLSQTPS